MIEAHNKQFLLSKTEVTHPFFSSWSKSVFGEYTLLTHPNLEVNEHHKEGNQLISLGHLYHYAHPEWSTQEIGEAILSSCNLKSSLKTYSETSGESVLLLSIDNQPIIVNDACAQMEVYYTSDCTLVGSQPKLMERVRGLEKVKDSISIEHFESIEFKKKQVFSSSRTFFKELYHLGANHYLNLQNQQYIRFYPYQRLPKLSIEKCANKTKEILTGYLKAAASRRTIAVPITAGIDSRVLVTCCLNAGIENVEFFVIQFPWMDDKDADLIQSAKIAQRLGITLKKYRVNEAENIVNESAFRDSLTLSDHRFNAMALDILRNFENRNITIVDGSIIGVGKNFFGRLLSITGKDLARISGYPKSNYATNIFNDWLTKSTPVFKKNGYHTLDMFFWEDRASNWMAKTKSKFLLVSDYYSAFNSRILFETLLSTKRRYRDSQKHLIFKHILDHSGLNYSDIAINPSFRKKLILLLKDLGIYYIYRNIGIKLGLINFK